MTMNNLKIWRVRNNFAPSGRVFLFCLLLMLLTLNSCESSTMPKSLKEICMMKPLTRECRGSVLKRGISAYDEPDSLSDDYLNIETPRSAIPLKYLRLTEKLSPNNENDIKLLIYLLKMDLMSYYEREMNGYNFNRVRDRTSKYRQ